jgi:hypothetical protein
MTETIDQNLSPELTILSTSTAHMSELELGRQTRNDWLESAIDSSTNQPLPAVELIAVEKEKLVVAFDDGTTMPQRTPTPTIPSTHFDVNDVGGNRIGFVVMKEPVVTEDQKSMHYIGDIKVIDEKRGQGYGQATYLAILKSLPPKTGLRTEGVLSSDAKKVWQSLVTKDVARQIGGEDRAPIEFETIF